MDKPLITTILEDLQRDLSGTINLLQPVAIQLLLWFFMYDLTTALLLAKPGSNPLIILKEKIKVWAFLYAIIYFFKDIMELIQELFQYFVKVSTGNEPGRLVELPYEVLYLAYSALKQLLDKVEMLSPSTWALFIGFIVGLFIFARICLTVGLVTLEYMFMSSLTVVLVPFMMFEKLRFVGDKVVGTLINLNMKIFVIQYLMFYFMKFLREPIEYSAEDGVLGMLENSFYWLVAMGMMAMMTMKGNEMAQTLISGVTSFGDSSELVRNAREGISKVGKAAGGAVTAGKTAAGATKGGIEGAIDGGLKGSLKAGGIGAKVGSILGGIGGAAKGGYGAYRNHKNGK
jgi:type IV secretory pathway TrbL component